MCLTQIWIDISTLKSPNTLASWSIWRERLPLALAWLSPTQAVPGLGSVVALPRASPDHPSDVPSYVLRVFRGLQPGCTLYTNTFVLLHLENYKTRMCYNSTA